MSSDKRRTERMQLLTTIQPDRVEELLADPEWCLQQKFDGVRVEVKCFDGSLRVTGRSGLNVSIGALSTLFPRDEDYSLDGEYAYGRFWCFDDTGDATKLYADRLVAVAVRLADWNIDRICRVKTYRTESKKREFFARCRACGAEGVVFKHLSGKWVGGSNHGVAYRFKFVERAEAIILGIGEKGRRSARLGMRTPDGSTIETGNVSLIAKRNWNIVHEAREILSTPPVVEIQYLYASRDGKLIQPRFIRLREDKEPKHCTTDQLKYAFVGQVTQSSVPHNPDDVDDEATDDAIEATPTKPPSAKKTKKGKAKKDDRFFTWSALKTIAGIAFFVLAWFLILFIGFLQEMPGKKAEPKSTYGNSGA